jgi:hypothetical protein
VESGVRLRAAWLSATLIALGATLGCTPHRASDPHPLAAGKSALEMKDGTPGPDSVVLPRSAGEKPPESAWLVKRTERYAGLFKGTQCDVLLVPMQVEGGGFDRPSRDIMTADFARALESMGRCVADPYLVDIAHRS